MKTFRYGLEWCSTTVLGAEPARTIQSVESPARAWGEQEDMELQECELAVFQETLLERLFTNNDAETILRLLQESCPSGPTMDYIVTLDPRMVEVAAELIKHWGKRSPL